MKTGLPIILAVFVLFAVLSGCSGNHDSRNVICEDMQAAFEQANLLSANIGIFTKTEQGDSVTYGECGSGVIFAREDGAYYAFTAAHAVSAIKQA